MLWRQSFDVLDQHEAVPFLDLKIHDDELGRVFLMIFLACPGSAAVETR
jgi:hypothetical protein